MICLQRHGETHSPLQDPQTWGRECLHENKWLSSQVGNVFTLLQPQNIKTYPLFVVFCRTPNERKSHFFPTIYIKSIFMYTNYVET